MTKKTKKEQKIALFDISNIQTNKQNFKVSGLEKEKINSVNDDDLLVLDSFLFESDDIDEFVLIV